MDRLTEKTMSDSLTAETFARHAHTMFRVHVEDTTPVELELVEVSEVQRSPGHEQFAIVFRGPNETFLGQGTRCFEHDRIGRFDLFVVPIGHDHSGYRYEAVFNRQYDRTERG
jgi:hypothetical protein